MTRSSGIDGLGIEGVIAANQHESVAPPIRQKPPLGTFSYAVLLSAKLFHHLLAVLHATTLFRVCAAIDPSTLFDIDCGEQCVDRYMEPRAGNDRIRV